MGKFGSNHASKSVTCPCHPMLNVIYAFVYLHCMLSLNIKYKMLPYRNRLLEKREFSTMNFKSLVMADAGCWIKMIHHKTSLENYVCNKLETCM